MDTITKAQGKFIEILSSFGIDRSYLDGQHHACPLCGGKDRFRFDDKDGRGTSICNQCGARSGVQLIADYTRKPIKEVLHEIDQLVGNNPMISAKNTPTKTKSTATIIPFTGITTRPSLLMKSSVHWFYHTPEGKQIAIKMRIECNTGNREKTFKWSTYRRSASGECVWVNEGLDKPILYDLHLIKNEKNILLVEGEKAAEAAKKLGFVATTLPNGANGTNNVDLTPLYDKTVTIWPDNDEPGRAYANKVAGLIALHCDAVKIVKLPDNLPAKFDLADPIPDWLDVSALIADAPIVSVTDPAIAANDHDVFVKQAVKFTPDTTVAALKAASAALQSTNQYYTYGGQLIRIIDDTKTVATPESVGLHLDDLIAWNNEKRNIHTPTDIKRLIVSTPELFNIPKIKAFTSMPYLTLGGQFIDKPGYNKDTGIYYLYSGIDCTIPAKITGTQIGESFERIRYLFSGCKFRNDLDLSVAISCLLTTVIRPALRTAPLFAFSAPVAGSGKSYTAQIILTAATGDSTLADWPRNHDEADKQLFAQLLAGTGFVTFDNVEGRFNSPKICVALTSPSIEGRVLGASKIETIATTATFIATGNNLTIDGDLERRSLLSVLDTKTEKPYQLKYDFDAISYCKANRAQIWSDCITVLLGYIQLDKPNYADLPPFGSFEDWSLIRGAIVTNWLPDPINSQREIRESNTAVNEVAIAYRALFEKYADSAFAASAIKSDAKNDMKLFESLPEFVTAKGSVNSHLLGRWLTKNRDVPCQGLKLVDSGKRERTGAVLWRIATI